MRSRAADPLFVISPRAMVEFPVNHKLVEDQLRAALRCPINGIKPVKRTEASVPVAVAP